MSLTLKKQQGERKDLSAPRGEVLGKLESLEAAGISTQDASTFERLANMIMLFIA